VTPLPGDLGTPETWAAALPPIDAVIHAACDFNTGMGAVDRRLLDRLLPALAARRNRPRLIITGWCWLFGATGDVVATEATPFRPLPAFAWMVPQIGRVLTSSDVEGIVVHPAMVYEAGGGVFHRFAREARAGEAVRIVQSEAVRWPLVHSEDLATLYARALERAPAGSNYIGASIEGFAVGRIARAFAERFGNPHMPPEIVSANTMAAELGEWARGYALDQRLSGAKARRELGWAPRHLYAEDAIRRGR
jgi:nucleoside-diphosphate-sugar epimerase